MTALIKMAAVALVFTLCLTPIVRRLALRFGLVDNPDMHRKLHGASTPLGGGVAVLIGLSLSIATLMIFSSGWRDRFVDEYRFLIGLACAIGFIVLVGLIDDRFGMHGRHKLLGQVIAAMLLICGGLTIERFQLFGWNVQLGIVAIPFTLFWLLGATNALNLLDGMDGMAGSVGVVLSTSVALMAYLSGHPTDAMLAAALAGCLLGFLAFNLPPASLFLGDAGSLLIGLCIGALAIRCSLKGPATVALAAPTAMLAIPILDTGMAILRRKLTGRSIYATDRGHLHHNLQRRGHHGIRAVAIIGLLCLVTAGSAVISVYMHKEWLALFAVAAVVCTLIVTDLFGRAESKLLVQRGKQLVRSLLLLDRHRTGSHQLTIRLQGNREWERLWNTLTNYAERFDLTRVQLNVTLPAIDEEFHANWQSRGVMGHAELWHSDIPLIANRLAVGRLRITGVCGERDICTWMGDLISGLRPFESQLAELLEDCATQLVKGRASEVTPHNQPTPLLPLAAPSEVPGN